MAQQPYMGSGLLLPPLSEVTNIWNMWNNIKKRIVAFPWQQWLRERTTMLSYTYIARLVNCLHYFSTLGIQAYIYMCVRGKTKQNFVTDVLLSEKYKHIFHCVSVIFVILGESMRSIFC